MRTEQKETMARLSVCLPRSASRTEPPWNFRLGAVTYMMVGRGELLVVSWQGLRCGEPSRLIHHQTTRGCLSVPCPEPTSLPHDAGKKYRQKTG